MYETQNDDRLFVFIGKDKYKMLQQKALKRTIREKGKHTYTYTQTN